MGRVDDLLAGVSQEEVVVIVPQFGLGGELDESATVGVNDGGALGGVEHQGARVKEG